MSWWNRMTTFFKEVPTFLKEVRTEMSKVSFPGREEVVATTIVVIVTSAIFGIFLFAADWVILWVYEGVFRVIGA
jgi:preprotein translocase subunit SecE